MTRQNLSKILLKCLMRCIKTSSLITEKKVRVRKRGNEKSDRARRGKKRILQLAFILRACALTIVQLEFADKNFFFPLYLKSWSTMWRVTKKLDDSQFSGYFFFYV